jgi:hypothetical protein
VLTLVHAGERLELSIEQAQEVTDYLWKGLLPAAVVSAAKLSEALARPRARMPVDVELETYEWQSVTGALDALGLPRQRDPVTD